jgi:hypothetical protein
MKTLVNDAIAECIQIPPDYERIDSIIAANIDHATAANSTVWTCPDYNKREYVHSFFQYPARMIPAVQKKLIEIVSEANPQISNMLDPFMGSATTLVACMENGLNCYGQDINPLSVLIAKTRTGPYYIDALKEKYADLQARLVADRSEKIEVSFPNRNKWFKKKISIELSKIVRSIRKESRPAIRRFFWVVLAETVRVSSNDRTSTYKLHIRPKKQIRKRKFSAIDVFSLHMDQSIEDFEMHADLLKKSMQLSNGCYKGEIDLRLWDSKENIYCPNEGPFYDLLVTSPPYGDNKTTVTYGQSSYLPLQWITLEDIDEKATQDHLSTMSEIDSRSLGGKLKNIDQIALNSLFQRSPTLKRTYETIKEKSPKDVKKVGAFFIDVDKTLDNIFASMKPNSYQIWTLGNRMVAKVEIPNDQIMTELLVAKGGRLVKKVEREIINKRMAKRNKDTSLMNTEDILIFRKIG